MPELPEVETVCLALTKIVKNAKVRNVKIIRKDLRWNIKKDFEIELRQKILNKPYRRGKYILIPTSKDNILLIHLGMSGQIKITADKKIPPPFFLKSTQAKQRWDLLRMGAKDTGSAESPPAIQVR